MSCLNFNFYVKNIHSFRCSVHTSMHTSSKVTHFLCTNIDFLFAWEFLFILTHLCQSTMRHMLLPQSFAVQNVLYKGALAANMQIKHTKVTVEKKKSVLKWLKNANTLMARENAFTWLAFNKCVPNDDFGMLDRSYSKTDSIYMRDDLKTKTN